MSLTSTMIAITLLSYLLGVLTLWPAIHHLCTRLTAARAVLLHDPLTGLRNRDGLAADHQTLTHNGQHPLTLLADLDGFKTVNDTHGHQTGDDLLTAVATRIGELAALYHGTAGRLGGDEFAVLIPATSHDPARIADTLQAVISQPITLATGPTLSITASIGYASARTSFSASLRAADIAMYHTKKSPTGQPTGYRPGMTIPNRPPHQRRHLRDRDVTA